jgi:hypothetical protein
MELKSFSWDVRSETCAVKTVDFSLLKEGTTGIPQGIAPFFFNSQLVEGEDRQLEFVVLGESANCLISRRNNRHRLFFKNLKHRLASYNLTEGDLLFFDKNPDKNESYIVSAILFENEQIIVPNYISKNAIGENRSTYSTYRVGHEFFSEQVRRRFDNNCAVTGTSDLSPKILIASHIKPWAHSNEHEKVDKFNGLLLTPNLDKLFDRGHLSFDHKGVALLGPKIDKKLDELWGLSTCRLKMLALGSQEYLSFHRDMFGFN